MQKNRPFPQGRGRFWRPASKHSRLPGLKNFSAYCAREKIFSFLTNENSNDIAFLGFVCYYRVVQ